MKKKGKRPEQVRQSKSGSQRPGVNLQAASLAQTVLSGFISSLFSVQPPSWLEKRYALTAGKTKQTNKTQKKQEDTEKRSLGGNR